MFMGLVCVPCITPTLFIFLKFNLYKYLLSRLPAKPSPGKAQGLGLKKGHRVAGITFALRRVINRERQINSLTKQTNYCAQLCSFLYEYDKEAKP
jgi:hypothetical protein